MTHSKFPGETGFPIPNSPHLYGLFRVKRNPPLISPKGRKIIIALKKRCLIIEWLYFSGLLKEARELRKNQTKAEALFWELVKNKKFNGLKFRRQHQIGSYIVDFYCHSERLIIELDGEVHNTEERKRKDKKRDAYLTSIGNTVLRFKNKDIFNNIDYVFKTITKSLSPFGRDGREGKENEVLFIDARNMGHLINRRTRELSKDDIQKIAYTYRAWKYSKGFSASPSGKSGNEEAWRIPRYKRLLQIGNHRRGSQT